MTLEESRKWFKEAQFGMMAHFGLYTLLGGEWKGRKSPHCYSEWIMQACRIPLKDYAALARSFNPICFDPLEWMKRARDAGMKYFVLTSKHHDGFALYRSKVSKYNVVDATPFKRDIVEEILTQYGDLCLIWFDVPVTLTPEQSESFVRLVRKHQPGCLINGRIGNGLGDYETPGDNRVAEKTEKGKLYESVGSMNDSWGYSPTSTRWKSVKDILDIKRRCAAIGSNYLLNVGPDPLGRLPAAAIGILDGLRQSAATISPGCSRGLRDDRAV